MLNRLAELRRSKNWSLQETADQLGIAKSTYAGYESGYREPSLKALTQIADLFGTSTDYILDRIDTKHLNTELTNYLKADKLLPQLTLDEMPLSNDEIVDIIAFIRLKRSIKSSKQSN